VGRAERFESIVRDSPDATSAAGRIASLCEETLRRNWREGRRHSDGARFAYTRPSPGHYPFQWYWDSCFAAIVWRRFEPDRARTELESLLAAEREDGFIGHTVFWDTPLNERQRLTYNVVSHDATMTASIQPPVLAWAWRIAVGSPSHVPAIARHYDWLAEHRDLDGDGLIWIVQPDESGLDASPQFDAVWRGHADGLPGFLLLVRRNRKLGYDLSRIAADGGPVCCEVLTNVLYALSLLALGRPSLTQTIVDRMYDEQAGLFRPLVRPRPENELAVTWAALSPLALPDLPEEIARRLVEDHLLDPERFWLPVPPPSVPPTERSFSRRESTLGIKRYWRGPTWINAAWLMWLGLIRLGYSDEAITLRDRLAGAVDAAGLREYYDPYDGRGMGATGFAWSSLIMEMIQPDARAARSFIGD
jgi:mannosylglycerate hydrolase MGH1-like protein